MADFKQRVEEALTEAGRCLGEERRLDQEFRRGWDGMRSARVRPVLKTAGEAMREHPVLGNPQLEERDGAVALYVFRDRRAEHPEFTLRCASRRGTKSGW